MLLCFACVEVLCALEPVYQSDVLYCSVLQCYGSFYVLRYFVHWNWRMTAMRFTVVCCNSVVFLKSVSEDRNGMAAPTCLDRYLVSSSVLRLYFVLQVILGRSHWNCLHHECDLNVRICTKDCVFTGKRRFRCAIVFCMCSHTLCIGTGASKRCVVL